MFWYLFLNLSSVLLLHYASHLCPLPPALALPLVPLCPSLSCIYLLFVYFCLASSCYTVLLPLVFSIFFLSHRFLVFASVFFQLPPLSLYIVSRFILLAPAISLFKLFSCMSSVPHICSFFSCGHPLNPIEFLTVPYKSPSFHLIFLLIRSYSSLLFFLVTSSPFNCILFLLRL